MNLDMETKRKLREMGYADLLAALESQDDGDYISIPFGERIKIAVDVAHSTFTDSKIKGLIKRANLRYENADVHLISLVEERKLDRTMLLELTTCAFMDGNTNLVFQGFTGSGKSFLACSFVKEACRQRRRAYYIRIPDLRETWEQVQDKPQGELKLLRKLSAFSCLCLDEWLLDPPDEVFRSFLFELLERRYDNASTLFCTQFMQKDWHARLGGGVHADAIMDRIVHNAIWFDAGEVNMREKLGK